MKQSSFKPALMSLSILSLSAYKGTADNSSEITKTDMIHEQQSRLETKTGDAKTKKPKDKLKKNTAGKSKKDANISIQSFEDKLLPTGLSCDRNSALSLSNERFQHGKNSLLWTSAENGFIQLSQQTPGLNIPENVKELRLWVYSEKPGGKLEIQAGDPGQFDLATGTYQSVDYDLNFQGWRSLWIQFALDGNIIKNGQKTALSSNPQIEIKAIRIKALNKASNKLYFDNLEVSDSPIPHGRLGNLQMPTIKNDPSNRHSLPWIALKNEADQKKLKNFDFKEQDLQRIMERFKTVLNKGIGNKGKAKKAFREFEKLVHIDAQGKTHGPAIYNHIVERYYKQKGFPGIHSSLINGALSWCADQYVKTGDESWKQRYISYLDFRHDKGYAYGSATMSLIFEAKNAANYLDSLIKMRPHLDDQRLRREAADIRWMCGYNYIYAENKAPVDADKILGDMMTLVVAIYLQPQTSLEEKKSKLYAFTKFKEIIDLTMIAGIDNAERRHIVKPDYAIWHHGMEMTFSYGYSAAHRYMSYYYLLHGTPAALDQQAAEGIISYYADLFTKKGAGSYMGSRGLSAGGINKYAEMLSYAAAADVSTAKQALKGFLQCNSVSLDSLPADLKAVIKANIVDDSTVRPYPIASGTHIRPFAATLIHHHQDSTAVIRGINQDIASNEIFLKEVNAANLYGQQQNNGFLQIYNADGPKKNGLDLTGGGWDWNLYPGATTAKLSHAQMSQGLVHSKIKFDRKTLSGGLSHFNKSGLYYQQLTASKKHMLKSLQGNKSWFFFDDLIVCLGSDLSLSGVDAPLVTTLFQYHHNKKNKTLPFVTYTAGELQEKTSTISESALASGDTCLLSPAGNSFFVESGDCVKIKRGKQKSYDPKNRNKESSGYVSSAWIDHGKNPRNATYEYAIKTNASKSSLSSFNKEMNYTVLQKNDAAHVVKHISSSSTGYAILKGGCSLPNGPLLNSKKALLSMITEKAQSLEVSVCDPRLKLSSDEQNPTKDVDRHTIHKILLKGSWTQIKNIKDKSAMLSLKLQGENTELTISCINGKSYDFVLCK